MTNSSKVVANQIKAAVLAVLQNAEDGAAWIIFDCRSAHHAGDFIKSLADFARS